MTPITAIGQDRALPTAFSPQAGPTPGHVDPIICICRVARRRGPGKPRAHYGLGRSERSRRHRQSGHFGTIGLLNATVAGLLASLNGDQPRWLTGDGCRVTAASGHSGHTARARVRLRGDFALELPELAANARRDHGVLADES